MASFKDSKDRDWEILLDAPLIMEVRDECDPKFMFDKGDENTYARLQEDPVLLCRVLYVLCKKQREEQKVSEEEFYMSVIGDAIDSATDAMLKAIVSFTPRRNRELLEVSAAKTDKIRQIATKKALDRINRPELEEQILQAIDDEIEQLVARVTQPKSATS